MAYQERANEDWLPETVAFRAAMRAAGAPYTVEQLNAFEVYTKATSWQPLSITIAATTNELIVPALIGKQIKNVAYLDNSVFQLNYNGVTYNPVLGKFTGYQFQADSKFDVEQKPA